MLAPTFPPLQSARSEAQLVQAVHAYLGEWMPAALARLPMPVRISEIQSVADISRLAVGIAQMRLDTRVSQDVRDVLEQLYPFFRAASDRVVQLHGAATQLERSPELMRRLFG